MSANWVIKNLVIDHHIPHWPWVRSISDSVAVWALHFIGRTTAMSLWAFLEMGSLLALAFKKGFDD